MSPVKINELLKLPKEDKMELLHLLWDNLSKEQESIEVPEWHKKILDERVKEIESGTAVFVSWEEIKKRFPR
jgi:putative addiction module component (TIGR02574 family)